MCSQQKWEGKWGRSEYETPPIITNSLALCKKNIGIFHNDRPLRFFLNMPLNSAFSWHVWTKSTTNKYSSLSEIDWSSWLDAKSPSSGSRDQMAPRFRTGNENKWKFDGDSICFLGKSHIFTMQISHNSCGPPARWGSLDSNTFDKGSTPSPSLPPPPPPPPPPFPLHLPCQLRMQWAMPGPELHITSWGCSGLRLDPNSKSLAQDAVECAWTRTHARMPNLMPDRMPEWMPENEKMPSRMPCRMSDRMSEHMPDRMSDRISEYIYIYLYTFIIYIYIYYIIYNFALSLYIYIHMQ